MKERKEGRKDRRKGRRKKGRIEERKEGRKVGNKAIYDESRSRYPQFRKRAQNRSRMP
jgi:hypothetical protein